jgi:diamine N-acetyltransferase
VHARIIIHQSILNLTIRGSKTTLRPVHMDDLNIIYNWENNPEFWGISEHSGTLTKNEIQEFIEISQDLEKDGQMRWMIQDLDGTVIGALDIFDFERLARSAGIGILIGESEDRRKGLAHDALNAFLEFQRSNGEIRQLICLIHKSNEASIALFVKNGFVKKGTKYFKGKEAVTFICEL